ncbi:MAG: uroporphyrinogen-III synthase [Nitrosomonadales bacterium]
MAEGNLAGLKVLVTRPRDQAFTLAQAIGQQGGTAVLCPLLEIAQVSDLPGLQAQVSKIEQADLAIFISPNAVQYGMAATGGRVPARVATVGEGSAKALRALGVAQVIVPVERFDSEGLLALPELQNIDGWQVMIFRGDGGRELLGDSLRQRGARVEYVTCYLRCKPQCPVNEIARVDLITVTSSEALNHLSQMIADSTELFDRPLFVTHPRIAELAKRLGWSKIFLTESGDDGLLAGLQGWAASMSRDEEAR